MGRMAEGVTRLLRHDSCPCLKRLSPDEASDKGPGASACRGKTPFRSSLHQATLRFESQMATAFVGLNDEEMIRLQSYLLWLLTTRFLLVSAGASAAPVDMVQIGRVRTDLGLLRSSLQNRVTFQSVFGTAQIYWVSGLTSGIWWATDCVVGRRYGCCKRAASVLGRWLVPQGRSWMPSLA